MREHLDIAEFETRTKIRAKYLRALEDEEWSLLPGYTFTKAFLRTYADMLGLDGRMMVDEFKRQYQDPSELDLAPIVPSRREVRRSRERARERPRPASSGDRGERPRERARRPARAPSRAWLIAVLVLAIAALLLAVGLLLNRGSHTKTTTTSTTTTRSHTRTTTTRTHAPVVRRVALAIIPAAPVRVCLIGYRSAGGAGRQRLSALIAPGARQATYHADNRFVVSFSGGAATMVIDSHHVAVPASVTTVSYEILLSGRHRLLPATKAPRCR